MNLKLMLLRASCVSVMALTCSLALADQPAGSSALQQALRGMAIRGEISQADSERLVSIARVQRPHDAPVLPNQRCWTAAVRNARQFASIHGAAPRLNAPPAAGYVDSSTYPIRVHYQDDTQVALANSILGYAEATWKAQVEQTGYPNPYTNDDGETPHAGVYYYIGDTGMGGGGYTEPLADIPTTPISDCSSRIVIDPANPASDVNDTTSHEFNHTTQMATDCAEAISAFENFTVAATDYFVPTNPYFLEVLPSFQQYPHFPVDYWTQDQSGSPDVYYQYGAALFPEFLKERFGGGDIKFLNAVWYSFSQNGTITINGGWVENSNGNHPNWFEGTDNVLLTQGSSFDDGFDEFTVWRSITGKHDDTVHFKAGKRYPEVTVAKTLTAGNLPFSDSLTVHQFASRHIVVNPGTYTGMIHASVTVDPAVSWGASVLLWRDNTPVERVKMTFTQSAASATIPSLSGVTRVMLVVSQHADSTYVPDDMAYDTERSFTYELDTGDLDAGADSGADAGADGGVHDAGLADAPADGAIDGGNQPGGGGGCGCRATGNSTASAWLLLVAGLGLIVSRRRIRRRSN